MRSLKSLRQIMADLPEDGPPTLRWVKRPEDVPVRLGVLSASFNPPTSAHVTMFERAHVTYRLDQMWLLLARANVDKAIFGADLAERLDMMQALANSRPYLSVAAVNHGRFADKIIALREHCPEETEVFFLLGYDTLVRLFDPKYYADFESELDVLFQQCEFIVANRGDQQIDQIEAFMQQPPQRRYSQKVHPLVLDSHHAQLSSTQVREQIRQEAPLTSLVPPEIERYLNQHPLYT